jgi:hypothetical protein
MHIALVFMPRKREISSLGVVESDRLIHYSEDFLSDFYERWTADPEHFSDDEFFRVQMHLLACDRCLLLGERCEDKARSHNTPPHVPAHREIKSRAAGLA